MRHKLVSLPYIKVFLLSFFIFFLSAVHAQQSQFDFRKTSWGMTKDQVKENESSTLVGDAGNMLWYTSTVASKNVEIVYTFLDHKLVNTGYYFIEEHSNKNDYIDDYEYLKEILIQKYSTPTFDETTWSNELFKDDPSDWGRAVSLGHLDYLSSWETDTTKIILGLSGDNHEERLQAAYYSKYSLREKAKEKAAQEKEVKRLQEKIEKIEKAVQEKYQSDF